MIVIKRMKAIIKEYIEKSEDLEETIEYVLNTALALNENSIICKELNKAMVSAVKEIIEEHDLCPECYSRTYTREVQSACYYEPGVYIKCCTKCDWHTKRL